MPKNKTHTISINVPASQDVVSAAIDLHKLAFVYAGKIANTKNRTKRRKIYITFKIKKRLDEFSSHLGRLPAYKKLVN